MKITMTIEADENEDTQHLISILRVDEYLSSIHGALELIRNRVKNNQISDSELSFLDLLKNNLYIED